MVVVPSYAKARALKIGTEYWVTWMNKKLFRCGTFGKAKTSAKKWNSIVRHIAARGGLLALTEFKDAWDAFMAAASADVAFKPLWTAVT